MGTDYRRKAKQYRHTSNAFFTLAGLLAVLSVVMFATGFFGQGAITFGCANVLALSGLSIRESSNQFARLARSQSRMNAWNRRNW